MRKITFTNNEVYHVYNRGVDKRNTFLIEKDHLRFMKSVDQFKNDKNNMFVEILAYCLMPNHFHLLIKQKSENGISIFMHKLGTGYTKYFNKKYNRSGSLFESTFKAKHVKNEEYYKHVSKYIHLNPSSLIKQLPANEHKLFLINYRWSSLYDYIINSSSLISLEILKLFKNSNDYLNFLFEAKLPTKNPTTI